MSGNAGQVNLPPDAGAVAEELTLLLRANGEAHDRGGGGLVVVAFCHAAAALGCCVTR